MGLFGWGWEGVADKASSLLAITGLLEWADPLDNRAAKPTPSSFALQSQVSEMFAFPASFVSRCGQVRGLLVKHFFFLDTTGKQK